MRNRENKQDADLETVKTVSTSNSRAERPAERGLNETSESKKNLMVPPDRGDDMVFELAVAAQARYIITHNVRDFRGVAEFGITPIRPADFLTLIRRTS